MGKSTCRKVGEDVVCGGARSGAGIPKKGLYRLHKGEKVLTPAQVKKRMKAPTAGGCRHCMAAKGKGKKKH